MRSYRATAATDEVFALAEGPLWDAPRERLLWVDIEAGEVIEGRLTGDRVRVVGRRAFDGTVGAVTSAADGRLLVAGKSDLIAVESEASTLVSLPAVPSGQSRRLNDGKTDPAGRFLVGTCPLGEPTGDERLLRVGDDGSITTLDADLALSNGLAWSCDGSLMYSIDSFAHTVFVRSYDAATGAVGQRSTLLRIDDGYPDGMCTDIDDHIWIAVCGRGEVRCFAPDGELVALVTVPAPRTTSVAFAGPSLDILVITTASNELTSQQLSEFPDSGRLFTARVGVAGHPVPPWSSWDSDSQSGTN